MVAIKETEQKKNVSFFPDKVVTVHQAHITKASEISLIVDQQATSHGLKHIIRVHNLHCRLVKDSSGRRVAVRSTLRYVL